MAIDTPAITSLWAQVRDQLRDDGDVCVALIRVRSAGPGPVG